MRRFEFLMEKARFNTNNIDPNRFNELDLAQYFNDAQRHIQTVIVENNVRHEIFSQEFTFQTTNGVETYDLPEDIFATSAINFVDFSSTSERDRFFPARALVNTDRRRGFGYIIRADKIIIAPVPSSSLTENVRIIYVRKLHEMGPRFGTITDVPNATDIVMTANLSDDQLLLSRYYDKLSIVYSDVKILLDKINIISDTADTPGAGQHTIVTDSDITTIVPAVGSFIVGGNVATTHSELPDVTELLLTNLVERTIQYVDSSSDVQTVASLTTEEREAIVGLFKSHPQDPAYPPIVTDEYMNT